MTLGPLRQQEPRLTLVVRETEELDVGPESSRVNALPVRLVLSLRNLVKVETGSRRQDRSRIALPSAVACSDRPTDRPPRLTKRRSTLSWLASTDLRNMCRYDGTLRPPQIVTSVTLSIAPEADDEAAPLLSEWRSDIEPSKGFPLRKAST